MKAVAVALLCSVVFAAGCQTQAPPSGPGGIWHTVTQNGLKLTLEAPERTYAPGSVIPLTITATNLGPQPMCFTAPTSAIVLVGVARQTNIGVETLHKYPEASAQVQTPWVLGPGQCRSFKMTLTVGSDWPTQEPLRLMAELAGCPAGPKPCITILVPACATPAMPTTTAPASKPAQ